MTTNETAQRHPYYDVRDKIIELDLGGDDFITAFETKYADAGGFEDHGAIQQLLREYYVVLGEDAPAHGHILSRLLYWGFLTEGQDANLQADFAVTSTIDQLVEAGFAKEHLLAGIMKDIFGSEDVSWESHWDWRAAIVQSRRAGIEKSGRAADLPSAGARLVFDAPEELDQSTISVRFRILSDGVLATRRGETIVSDDGRRVYAETSLLGEDGYNVLSHKLDPNESDDSYAVVASEIRKIKHFTMPVTTADVDRIATLAHNYVINGRPAWG